LFVLWPILVTLSLGLLLPYVAKRKKEFYINNHAYGKTNFSVNADAGVFYKLYLKTLVFFVPVILAYAGLVGTVISMASQKNAKDEISSLSAALRTETDEWMVAQKEMMEMGKEAYASAKAVAEWRIAEIERKKAEAAGGDAAISAREREKAAQETAEAAKAASDASWAKSDALKARANAASAKMKQLENEISAKMTQRVADTSARSRLLMVFVGLLYAGLFCAWVGANFLKARLFVYLWNNTQLGEHRFKARMRARDFILLKFVNGLVTWFTLGLLLPFAMVRLRAFQLSCLRVEKRGDLDAFVAASQPDLGALGDSATDFWDFDIGFGM